MVDLGINALHGKYDCVNVSLLYICQMSRDPIGYSIIAKKLRTFTTYLQ